MARLLAGLLLVSLGLGAPRAALEAAQPAASYARHAGFPRSEPISSVNFASPTIVDLDGDGQLELLQSDGRGCIYAWNAAGQLRPGFPLASTGPCNLNQPRTADPIAIGNINADPGLEIVIGARGASNTPGQLGKVFVWNAQGTLLWSREMRWDAGRANGTAEVYGVTLANIIGDSRLEVLAGTNNNGSLVNDGLAAPNVYAWTGDGSLLPGFPVGYRTAGIYNSISAANVAGDCHAELVISRDHRYYNIYNAAGQPLPGFPIETLVDPSQPAGTHPSIEFTHNPASIGDLNGDGQMEIVVAGKVRLKSGLTPDAFGSSALLVLRPNGTRPAAWQLARLGSGPAVYTDFFPSQGVALADLNNDGQLEIVLAGIDGYVRAYNAQNVLLWQYNYAQGRALFASEPVIGDVDGDGALDVVFGVYDPSSSETQDAYVGVYGLNAAGQPLANFPLRLNLDDNGVRAAPTLADLDGDGLLEIAAVSWNDISGHAPVYVWDTPAAFRPDRLPWPTARHDLARTGAYSPPPAAARLLALPVTGPYHLFLPMIVSQDCGG